MSKVVKPPQSETRDVSVVERSWRVELLTEIPLDADVDAVDFPVVVHREQAEYSDPAPPGGQVFYKGPIRGKSRGNSVAAEAGPPDNGTDGTDPAHYSNPVTPFFPRIDFQMGDVLNNPATIDIEDNNGNVLMANFPLAYLPFAIIAGIEYIVEDKKNAAIAQAITQAVEAAS